MAFSVSQIDFCSTKQTLK